jgi:hypothetical protein
LAGADLAGNTTTVSYSWFLGFLPPLKDSLKAGQTLNVRFALGDADGARSQTASPRRSPARARSR